MFSTADLLIGFVATWGVGLAPALAARFLWKKEPLSAWLATTIAGVSCAVFAVTFLVVRSALGEVDARISPAWILVFIVSRAIMMGGKRADLIRRLHAMIADENTPDDRRALAREKLRQLETTTAERAPARGLALAGGQLTHLGQLGAHPQRLAQFDGDDLTTAGTSQPRVRRYGGKLALVVGIMIAFDVALMVSGCRILVGEKLVPAGQRYETAEWVHGSDDRDVIVCWYWTGRGVREIGHWYGLGEGTIDECPLVRPLDPSD